MSFKESEISAANDFAQTFAHRPTWAEINLDALAHNFREVRRKVGSETSVIAVVKANAYGHGAVECARRLAKEGADWFGVALPEEGIELREAGITQPILSFGGFWEGQEAACIKDKIVPVIYRAEMAETFDAAARAANTVADVFVKIDTGMGRLGVRGRQLDEFIDRLISCVSIRVAGVMTHFAAADEPERNSFTEEQAMRFREALDKFAVRGINPQYRAASNSAATFAHDRARFNMVRPGGVLYGLWRDILQPVEELTPALQPVMSLRTRIALLKPVPLGEPLGYGCTFSTKRETQVATLPVGYHDGLMRALSNAGCVIVRGRFAPIIGRVSMDLTLVDVTDVPGVATGDVVTLIGADGALSITAEDIARQASTLSYEVTCGISERVPRRFV
ncbi:MAG: alanine racemase [Pyrinomonadaceae bacterium]